MSPNLFSVLDFGKSDLIAPGLSLREAFALVMALSGREWWSFARTGRQMHLVIHPAQPGDPPFESWLAVDRAARNDIMAQVCAHGFGQFCVVPEDGTSARQRREFRHRASV